MRSETRLPDCLYNPWPPLVCGAAANHLSPTGQIEPYTSQQTLVPSCLGYPKATALIIRKRHPQNCHRNVCLGVETWNEYCASSQATVTASVTASSVAKAARDTLPFELGPPKMGAHTTSPAAQHDSSRLKPQHTVATAELERNRSEHKHLPSIACHALHNFRYKAKARRFEAWRGEARQDQTLLRIVMDTKLSLSKSGSHRHRSIPRHRGAAQQPTRQ